MSIATIWERALLFALGTPMPTDLRRAFLLYTRKRTSRTTCALAMFLLIMNFLAWPSDQPLLRDPVLVQLFVVLRLGLTGVFLGLLGLLAVDRIATSAAALPLIAAFACTGAALGGWISGTYGGLETPFFYVIYTFCGVTMILSVGLLARIAITLAFTLSFIGPYFLLFPQHLEYPFVSSNLLVVVSANFSYVVIGEALYRLMRTNFLQAAALEEAHRKSDGLLLNILPGPIAERLKEQQQPIADGFAEVTVLFADIANFTPLSSSLSPTALVALLNRIFSEFDALAQKHGLEKIKTIGDAYMVAGGLPAPHQEHARAIAEMALEMRETLNHLRQELNLPLEIRIGINSGPVVAGVIGMSKFIYDLWGDTVNTASRMESHGMTGEIQLTDEAARRLMGAYELELRGEIEVKGKGWMTTWLLKGRRERAE